MIKLKGNCGVLTLGNSFGIVIKLSDCGDYVQYQYSNDTEPSELIEIDYFEDTDNLTGYAEDSDTLFQPGFITSDGSLYFLGQFMRTVID